MKFKKSKKETYLSKSLEYVLDNILEKFKKEELEIDIKITIKQGGQK